MPRTTLSSTSSSSSFIFVCFFCLSAITLIQTSSGFRIRTAGDALDYLKRFGYIENDLMNVDNKWLMIIDLPEVREGIRQFQESANLIPNGKLNRRTMRAMNKERCGNRDLRVDESDEIIPEENDDDDEEFLRREVRSVGLHHNRRRKNVLVRRRRYDLQGPRWRKKVLTYRITKFATSSLKPKTLQKEIDLAFKYWERVTNLTFRKVWDKKGKADIEISFFSGDHGDEESFDGPSKTLAHAFYPTKGRIHFDNDEVWTANRRKGHNLRTVCVHEIGHALGLGHSTEKRAVMYLMYQDFKDKLKLHEDDISAIQRLYGPKIEVSSSSGKNANEVYKILPSSFSQPSPNKMDGMVSASTSPDLPDLCVDPKIDAISTLSDGFIYVFKGEYFFRMRMNQPYSRDEYPKRINETFYGLPSNLDTVLTVANGKSYFFKGHLYWRSTGTKMDDGYPKKISTNFLGIPNNLDGSTIWSWNNMTYFFKKNRYWRYSFEHPRKLVETGIISRERVSNGKIKIVKKNASGYPRKITTNWPGIPDEIEDAFLAPNGRTYFFKNGEYWQFHDPESLQEAASYPRPSPVWWFGCTNFSPDQRKVRHVRYRKDHI